MAIRPFTLGLKNWVNMDSIRGAEASAIEDLCCGTEALEKRMAELKDGMDAIAGIAEKCLGKNGKAVLEQEGYDGRIDDLAERYDELKAEYDAAAQAVKERDARRQRMERFEADIEGWAAVTEFDVEVWSSLVDFVTVYGNKRIVVTFKDGTESDFNTARHNK